jgi:hypothetical protein
MDEGFNTFIDVYASDAFNHGEYAPKRDGEVRARRRQPGGRDPAVAGRCRCPDADGAGRRHQRNTVTR